LSLVFSLALCVFLLLSLLPFFSYFLELCTQVVSDVPRQLVESRAGFSVDTGCNTFWCSFLAMRLHRDVRIQMIERSVGLLTSLPATLIHPLDLFEPSSRSLLLMCAWDRNKRVNGGSIEMTTLSESARVLNATFDVSYPWWSWTSYHRL